MYGDRHGRLWMNSETGIICFDKKSGHSQVFTPKEGTLHIEGNRASHHQDESGRLYFGSVTGLTIFHPDDFYDDFQVQALHTIHLLDIRQNSNKTDQFQLEDRLAEFNERGYLLLQEGSRYAEISFAPLVYPTHQNFVFSYRLENQSQGWVRMDGRKVSLRDLPFGNHRLEIRASSFGKVATHPFFMNVVVKPPIYLQSWFLILAALSLLALTLGFIRWRTSQFKKQEALLQEQIEKRTREINTQKVAIEQKNKELAQQTVELQYLDKVKNRFFTNVSHELRTPLTLMLGPVNSILKRKKDDSKEKTLLQYVSLNNCKHPVRPVSVKSF